MISEREQEELLALGWVDFSTYPKPGQDVLVHASGFDTHERAWKHLFIEVSGFDPLRFPTEGMVEAMGRHHCKWTFEWLPSKTEA